MNNTVNYTQTMAITFGSSWKIMLEGSIPRVNFNTRKFTYYRDYRGTIDFKSPYLTNQLRYLD